MRKRQSKPAISLKRVVISKLLKASSDAEILKFFGVVTPNINVTHSGQSLINVGGLSSQRTSGGVSGHLGCVRQKCQTSAVGSARYSIYGLQRAEEFMLG